MDVRRSVRRFINSRGWDLHELEETGLRLGEGTDPADVGTVNDVRDYTMTSPERLLAACQAIRYVNRFSIPGAIVECGVWRGGSMMAMARTLKAVSDHDRDLYLFDTFSGMTEPTDVDIEREGESASAMLAASSRDARIHAYVPLDEVKANMAKVGYPTDKVHYVIGKVEDTLPMQAPEQIAVLRLDTDWYESTRHELEHLVDRVAPNGVLIIDDYGDWQGARKAVDEWLAQRTKPTLLQRIDHTGRQAILV